MLKKPNIRNPTEFGDVFIVLLAYVIFIILFTEFLESEQHQYFVLITSVIIFGWGIWAIHNILEERSDDLDEEF